MNTNTAPTADQITKLRTESATAGDHAQVLICDLALGDVSLDADTTIESLRIASFISASDQRRIASMDRDAAVDACAEVLDAARAELPADPLLGYSPDEIIVGPGGQTLAEAAAAEQAYFASLTTALTWARTAEAGEYLVEYEDTGMTDVDDSGSRCGYSDMDLESIGDVLAQRDLRIVADDRGLVAQTQRAAS